jgi:DNA-binding MarR family transcriptional regulator
MTHPIQDLDEMVHQRSRLGILAVLAEGGRVQFGFLQKTLDLSDGNLSRHLTTLENVGYLRIEKGYEGRRPRTWAHITKAGRRALASEIAQLKALMARVEQSQAPDSGLQPQRQRRD